MSAHVTPPRCKAFTTVESRETVVNGLGQTLGTSPGIDIQVEWDFGDEKRALDDLDRAVAHCKARIAKVTDR